jgi:hypothetical protein
MGILLLRIITSQISIGELGMSGFVCLLNSPKEETERITAPPNNGMQRTALSAAAEPDRCSIRLN